MVKDKPSNIDLVELNKEVKKILNTSTKKIITTLKESE
jgi:hypothetical protein